MAIILGVVSFQMGISNYCFGALKWYERLAFIISALFFITFVFTKVYPCLFIAMVLFVVNMAWAFKQRKQYQTTIN